MNNQDASNNLSNSSFNVRASFSTTDDLYKTMTFSSFPNLSLFFLNISLITLLILFRWDAFLIPLPTLIPNFGPSSSVRLSRKIIKLFPLFLLPCKRACRNCHSLLILTLLGYPSFFTGGIFSSRDYRSAGNGQP
jgi:hypothetical protein